VPTDNLAPHFDPFGGDNFAPARIAAGLDTFDCVAARACAYRFAACLLSAMSLALNTMPSWTTLAFYFTVEFQCSASAGPSKADSTMLVKVWSSKMSGTSGDGSPF